jgi:large repetitive protein
LIFIWLIIMSDFSPAQITIQTTALIMLVLLLSVIETAETRAATDEVSGTVIVVNTTNDELNNNGNCSLREALQAANLDQAVDACPAGNGLDTITLPKGKYVLTRAGINEDAGSTGDLDINSSLIIRGAGMGDTLIDGNQLDRVFHITGGYTVKISGMSIQNGFAAVDAPTGDGGAGILNHRDGDLTLSKSILNANHAEFTGGGLDNAGKAALFDVTISGNTAEIGGGIFSNGTLLLKGITFVGNMATHSGGGLDNNKSATLTNVTFSDNTAILLGGGINNDQTLYLINTTLYNNSTAINNETTGNITTKNTIVAGSTDGDNCKNDGTIKGDYNLDSGVSCNFSSAHDQSGTDPLLDPLGDNKGLTWTHALQEGSPAIDRGTNSDCPLTDQRGALRPADGDGAESIVCDIGAYEHNAAFPDYAYLFLPLTNR